MEAAFARLPPPSTDLIDTNKIAPSGLGASILGAPPRVLSPAL